MWQHERRRTMLARLFTHPFAATCLCLLFSAWQQHQPLAPAPVSVDPMMCKFVCFGVMKFRAISFLLRQRSGGCWLVVDVEGRCWPAFSHTRLQQPATVSCSQHGSSTNPWRLRLSLQTP